MLLRRVFVALGFQLLQRLDQLLAGLVGLDDGGDVGIGETAPPVSPTGPLFLLQLLGGRSRAGLALLLVRA